MQNYIAIKMEQIVKEYDFDDSDRKKKNIEWLKKGFRAELVGLFQYLIQTYMDLFLLYLISKFSEKKVEEKIFDRVLNRKVSVMVYI